MKSVISFLQAIIISANCYAQSITHGGYVIDVTSEVSVNSGSNLTCDTTNGVLLNPFPTGMTSHGQNYWCLVDRLIYRFNGLGQVIDSFPNPAPFYILNNDTIFNAGGLCNDGVNLWYADEAEAMLYKMNLDNGTVIDEFELPSHGQSDPNGYGIAWDGQFLWHSQYYNSQKLYKLNPNTGMALDSVDTDLGYVAIEWFDNELFGSKNSSLSSSSVYSIDVNSGSSNYQVSWCVPLVLGLATNDTSLCFVSGTNPTDPTDFSIGRQSMYIADFNPTGIPEPHSSHEVNVAPNPNHGEFLVKLGSNPKGRYSATLFDNSGRVMYCDEAIVGNGISISKNLSPGVYQLLLRFANEDVVFKKVVVLEQ